MTKHRLGELTQEYSEINVNGELRLIDDLQGINNNKYFQESNSNKNDIDLNRYKICRNNTFAYNKATSRNGGKISIAYRMDGDCLVSPSYITFKVKRSDLILDDYLMLWFRRPEFDRYVRFNSWGSATEFFTYEQFANTEIDIPSIQEQEEVIRRYKVVADRIEILKKINDNLESTAQVLFQEKFASYYDADKLPDGYSIVSMDSLCIIKGGKRLPADSELLDTPTAHPYIRVRDVGKTRYVCLNNQFQYIDEETHSAISRYTVNTGDILISIVGTIGLIGKVHSSLNNANLTENCVKLTDIKNISPDYLYYTLCYKKQTKEIELLMVGAVQAKLPMYNIQSMKILVPPANVLSNFQRKVDILDTQIEANTVEIQKLNEFLDLISAKMFN